MSLYVEIVGIVIIDTTGEEQTITDNEVAVFCAVIGKEVGITNLEGKIFTVVVRQIKVHFPPNFVVGTCGTEKQCRDGGVFINLVIDEVTAQFEIFRRVEADASTDEQRIREIVREDSSQSRSQKRLSRSSDIAAPGGNLEIVDRINADVFVR